MLVTNPDWVSSTSFAPPTQLVNGCDRLSSGVEMVIQAAAFVLYVISNILVSSGKGAAFQLVVAGDGESDT